MKFALSKEEIALQAMVDARSWLAEQGVRYQFLPPSHIKIGVINFWPTTGTITIDGAGPKRAAKGLAGLETLLMECGAVRGGKPAP